MRATPAASRCYGAGSRQARWFVAAGAATAADEKAGQPLAGDPGKLFDNMLAAVGLSREQDVWVTQLVKCRPASANGGDRAPTSDEAAACRPFLERELALTRRHDRADPGPDRGQRPARQAAAGAAGRQPRRGARLARRPRWWRPCIRASCCGAASTRRWPGPTCAGRAALDATCAGPSQPMRDGADSYQLAFHRRWGHLRRARVRALAWLLDSPDLLDAAAPHWHGRIASIGPVTPEVERWLADLDHDPAPLDAALGPRVYTRLGLYAEKLMAFYYQQQGRLVAHGLQIRASRNDTVGEFDFLLDAGPGLRRAHRIRHQVLPAARRGPAVDAASTPRNSTPWLARTWPTAWARRCARSSSASWNWARIRRRKRCCRGRWRRRARWSRAGCSTRPAAGRR